MLVLVVVLVFLSSFSFSSKSVSPVPPAPAPAPGLNFVLSVSAFLKAASARSLAARSLSCVCVDAWMRGCVFAEKSAVRTL